MEQQAMPIYHSKGTLLRVLPFANIIVKDKTYLFLIK